MASVSGYRGFNKKALMQGLTMHVKNIEKPQLLAALKNIANGVVSAIDGGYIPEYTGNLHDATGCAVYADGKLAYFQPTAKHATKMGKSGFGGVNHYRIDGSEFLQRTVQDASSSFSTGIWFVLFSAVPYAYYINAEGSPIGRGQNFFNTTIDNAVKQILAALRPVGQVSISV